MKLVVGIIKPFKLDDVKEALHGARRAGAHRLRGAGLRPPDAATPRCTGARSTRSTSCPKVRIEVLVDDDDAERVVDGDRRRGADRQDRRRQGVGHAGRRSCTASAPARPVPTRCECLPGVADRVGAHGRARRPARSSPPICCGGRRRSRASPAPASGSPRASTSRSASRRSSRSRPTSGPPRSRRPRPTSCSRSGSARSARASPGYVTPKVAVAAIVGNDAGEILLTQRADSGIWLYPVGWADVGYSPSEVAVKEVYEETGIEVEPVSLIAVLDGLRLGLRDDSRCTRSCSTAACSAASCTAIRSRPVRSASSRATACRSRSRAAPLGRPRVPRRSTARCSRPTSTRPARRPGARRRPEAVRRRSDRPEPRSAGSGLELVAEQAGRSRPRRGSRSHASPTVSWSTSPAEAGREPEQLVAAARRASRARGRRRTRGSTPDRPRASASGRVSDPSCERVRVAARGELVDDPLPEVVVREPRRHRERRRRGASATRASARRR